ncbi:hypothetical protein [Desulfoferrobacter suflitae]|uniref:hypothetical protein n=1 Tax=Desulfoferrobacter suflitae TaxID=2865782 RepID=UPI00216476BF|nr:hypothetical protein [Desulfoferrobacter suflitae]MCK8600624.1 hypothetical protein [Desulfoferrobacter suflitae]
MTKTISDCRHRNACSFGKYNKYNITQRKFVAGDGGIKRLVWMPKMLKDEIYSFLEQVGHPVLAMEPILG